MTSAGTKKCQLLELYRLSLKLRKSIREGVHGAAPFFYQTLAHHLLTMLFRR
jgi:hypothetical protein